MALKTSSSGVTGVLLSKTPIKGKIDQQTLVYKDNNGVEQEIVCSFYQSGTQTVTLYDGFSQSAAETFAAEQTVQDTVSVATFTVWSTLGGSYVAYCPYVSHSKRGAVRYKAGRMYSVEVTEETVTVAGMSGAGNA